MLSSELATGIRQLLVELDASEPLFAGLSRLSETEGQFTPYLEAIAKGGQELNGGAGGLHSHIVNARQVLPQLPSRSLYRAIERSTAALRRFYDLNPEVRASALYLAKGLEEFSSLYETYLAEQTGITALPVLRAAPIVLKQLERTRETLRQVVADLEPPQDLSDEEEVFAVYFSGHHDLAEITSKLAAIATIIQTVASLGPPGKATSAPRVLHVESGSLLIKLAIAKWVAGIVRPWVSALASYFYRTRTVEGSLAATTTAAKAAIKQTLDVRQLLNKAGIETPDLDQRLEDAATAMAENVAVLVRNQIRMKLDDQDFVRARHAEALEHTQQRQLPPPQDSADPLRLPNS